MKNKRLIVILGMAVALILGGLSWWLFKGQQALIVTVESVQPPICVQDMTDGPCGDGVIEVRTQNGAKTEYKYASDVLLESDKRSGDSVVSLQKGEKVKLTISQGSKKILRIQTVE